MKVLEYCAQGRKRSLDEYIDGKQFQCVGANHAIARHSESSEESPPNQHHTSHTSFCVLMMIACLFVTCDHFDIRAKIIILDYEVFCTVCVIACCSGTSACMAIRALSPAA